MESSSAGIHHVTCITRDVQKCTDFYVGVLGLRFVKKSINQDLPDTYHIYFGDYLGSPGTAMTFFGWPTWPGRRTGSGQVTTVSFAVPQDSIDFWTARLKALGVSSRRGMSFGADAIVLNDPDGIEIALVGRAIDAGWVKWPEGPVAADHALRGFHSLTLTVAEAEPTATFLTQGMGFRKSGVENGLTRYETGSGGPDATLDLIESGRGPLGEESVGTVHHVAWRTPDDGAQKAWRQRMVEAGRNVTPVIDRWYFKSIYFREPGGVLFEIATDAPGFTVDERPADLGKVLSLPPWFQVRRELLDVTLPPIVVPTTATTGAGH